MNITSAKRIHTAWLVLLVVYGLYAGLFIYRTSFLVEGERYFSLFDDAMISMRYAKNLASGHGLVWNPGGARVEGFTNLGWTLYMALLHLVPLAPAKISLLVQASSAVFLLINLIFVKKLAVAVSDDSGFVWLASVVFTAFYLPLNGWSLQGMEVGVLALILTVVAWMAVKVLQSGRFSAWPYLLLAVGMLVRPDMAVPFLGVLVYMACMDRGRRGKHLLVGLVVFGMAILAQTIFRISYYGDWLPNSYYLKLQGYPFILRLTRGLYVGLVAIWRMNWVLFLVPLVLLVPPRRVGQMLLLVLFAGQLAYSVYVGGDAWESWGGANRYVCIAMPCFFIAFSIGLSRLGAVVREYLAAARPGLVDSYLTRYSRRISLVVVVLCLVSFNSIYGPAAMTEVLLLKPTLHVDKNQKMVERAMALRRVTDSEATIAVVWDGAIPYFADRQAVSILGKNDKTIARRRMRMVEGPGKLVGFYPGHLKWDYAYSIGMLKPDVVVQLWEAQDEAGPFLMLDYLSGKAGDFTFHFRQDSHHILWDRVELQD